MGVRAFGCGSIGDGHRFCTPLAPYDFPMKLEFDGTSRMIRQMSRRTDCEWSLFGLSEWQKNARELLTIFLHKTFQHAG